MQNFSSVQSQFVKLPVVERNDMKSDARLIHPSTPFQGDITWIEWMPNTQEVSESKRNILTATTWDGTIRHYKAEIGNFTNQIKQLSCISVGVPILKSCWHSDSNQSVSVACIDGCIRTLDLNKPSEISGTIKATDEILSSVYFAPNHNLVISLGYDKSINVWDPRSRNSVFSYQHQDKICVSDFEYPLLGVGTASEKIALFDINNFSQKTEYDSPLGSKSQLQCLALNEGGDRIGIGTIDGRSTFSHLVQYQNQTNKGYKTDYSFSLKTNKIEQKSPGSLTSHLFPVNAIGFSKRNKDWFFTAGSDGCIHFWDVLYKSQIKKIQVHDHPITAASTNKSGEYLAYATGDDFHQGPKGMGKWPIDLAVHVLVDTDLKYSKKPV